MPGGQGDLIAARPQQRGDEWGSLLYTALAASATLAKVKL
jgi:hypothetical protein